MKTSLHFKSVTISSGLLIFCNTMQLNAQLICKEGRVSINPKTYLISPVKPNLFCDSDGAELVVDANNSIVYLWSDPSIYGAST